jgi:hypothetical protein
MAINGIGLFVCFGLVIDDFGSGGILELGNPSLLLDW